MAFHTPRSEHRLFLLLLLLGLLSLLLLLPLVLPSRLPVLRPVAPLVYVRCALLLLLPLGGAILPNLYDPLILIIRIRRGFLAGWVRLRNSAQTALVGTSDVLLGRRSPFHGPGHLTNEWPGRGPGCSAARVEVESGGAGAAVRGGARGRTQRRKGGEG